MVSGIGRVYIRKGNDTYTSTSYNHSVLDRTIAFYVSHPPKPSTRSSSYPTLHPAIYCTISLTHYDTSEVLKAK